MKMCYYGDGMLSLRNLVLLSTMWLVSCTNFCQNAADLGAVYQGVLIMERDTCYRYDGKLYAKGQRALFQRTYVDHPYAIAKPLPPCYEIIEGSEGEVVYREIRQNEEHQVEFSDYGTWQVLPIDESMARPLEKEMVWEQRVDSYSRELTPHALYAYPLAGATLVCVDVPLNLATIVLAPPMIAGAFVYSVSCEAVRQIAPTQE